MTINSPDDIGAAISPDVETAPLTNTRDIDWLRSQTVKTTTRTAVGEAKVSVSHVAVFGIRPETVEDHATDHSRTGEKFRPEFMTAEWRNGILTRVDVSGSLRVKSGGVSDKVTRRARRDSHSDTRPLDRTRLAAPVAAALAAYETAVSVERNGARK